MELTLTAEPTDRDAERKGRNATVNGEEKGCQQNQGKASKKTKL